MHVNFKTFILIGATSHSNSASRLHIYIHIKINRRMHSFISNLIRASLKFTAQGVEIRCGNSVVSAAGECVKISEYEI